MFVVFAALLWVLRLETLAHDREEIFVQSSGQASRMASRLARFAETNLGDHAGKLEESVMLAAVDLDSSSIVVLDASGIILLAHDSS